MKLNNVRGWPFLKVIHEHQPLTLCNVLSPRTYFGTVEKAVFHEQLFVFPISAIRRRSWLPIRQASAFFDGGMAIDWRVDLKVRTLYVRIRKVTNWIPIWLVWTGKGERKLWSMYCPSCDSTVSRVYFRGNALPSCSHCDPLPRARQKIKSNSIVRRTLQQIDRGDFESVRKTMTKLGEYPFRVRQALELRGLLPNLYTPKRIKLRRYWETTRLHHDKRIWDGQKDIIYVQGSVQCRKEWHGKVIHTSFRGGQEEEPALRIIEDIAVEGSEDWPVVSG